MQGSSPPVDAVTAAGEDLFLEADDARLRPGDRFPNFLLSDQTGAARWFVQRGQGNGQLVVLDPDRDSLDSLAALASDCTAAELDCIGIAQAAPAGIGLPVLIDSADKIRPALRRMSGLPRQGPAAFLLDRNQRVVAMTARGDLARWGLETWRRGRAAEAPPSQVCRVAPVLIVPNVLSPDQCRALIARWHTHGHEPGHVTTFTDGEQVRRVDEGMKRRIDHSVDDPAVARSLLALLARRLGPEVERAFQYRGLRFDRPLIVRYDAERGDYFRRHRDNATPATETRRFALTVNLNSGEYEGGDLIFPEYGPQRFKVPAGAAILFSCSLLHEALPVTRGRRFALLSFLRDIGDAGERR